MVSVLRIESGTIELEKSDRLLWPNSFNIDWISAGAGPMCRRTNLSGWVYDSAMNKYWTSLRKVIMRVSCKGTVLFICPLLVRQVHGTKCHKAFHRGRGK